MLGSFLGYSLPDTGGPYLIVMAIGFFLGWWGKGMNSKWVVIIGIVTVIVAALLFQISVTHTAPDLPSDF